MKVSLWNLSIVGWRCSCWSWLMIKLCIWALAETYSWVDYVLTFFSTVVCSHMLTSSWYWIRICGMGTLYLSWTCKYCLHLLRAYHTIRTSMKHWNLGKPMVYKCHFLCQFGEVLATTDHEETIVISEIDYSLIEQRRYLLYLCSTTSLFITLLCLFYSYYYSCTYSLRHENQKAHHSTPLFLLSRGC